MYKTYFVFGSNELGIHGAGAALYAKKHYGAKIGVGEGFSGSSYALPTKKDPQTPREFIDIIHSVNRLIEFAKLDLTDTYLLTKVGCGLAGIPEVVMSYLFIDAPSNILLIDDNGQVVCIASRWFDKAMRREPT